MALLYVTELNGALCLKDGTSVLPALASAILHTNGPIQIMVHGYKYAPHVPGHCPFASLYAPVADPGRARSFSWPHALGQHRPDHLIIGFGWHARGSLRKVYDAAGPAGNSLAELIRLCRILSKTRPVQLVAHSLGARVALQSVFGVPVGSLSHILLLAGAEYQTVAHSALNSPAGQQLELLNVTSAENDLFDAMFEWLIPARFKGDGLLGQGISAENSITVQIDDPRTIAGLSRLGFLLGPSQIRICHWSTYIRPGVFRFYRSVLNGDTTLDTLKSTLPDTRLPRWSRLIPRIPVRSIFRVPLRRQALKN